MKAKITNHEIREVDGSIILYMQYNYKGVDSTVSIIDLPEMPNTKVIKQYIKTAELEVIYYGCFQLNTTVVQVIKVALNLWSVYG